MEATLQRTWVALAVAAAMLVTGVLMAQSAHAGYSSHYGLNASGAAGGSAYGYASGGSTSVKTSSSSSIFIHTGCGPCGTESTVSSSTHSKSHAQKIGGSSFAKSKTSVFAELEIKPYHHYWNHWGW